MTSTALDLNHGPATALAIQPGQIAWDTTQIAALGQLGLADAGDGDRSVFLHVCQRTGLDPFARQIYMIPRNEKVPGSNQWRKKWTIQTGIDGYRVNRTRAEKASGVRGILGRAVFYDPDGNEHKVWVQPRPPVACEITYTVRDRDGTETPYTSVLRFTEYCQTDNDGNLIAQWKTKPAHMLEKCTEADVYRKAFPQDFSGIYLDDAMPQDGPAPQANGDGRPRGRVTAGEIIERRPAAEDDTRSQPRVEPPAGAQQGTTGESSAQDAHPRAAGAAPSRGEQPPPPQLAEDQPGSASEDQLQALHITLGGLGFTTADRDQKLKIAETITGRAPLTGPVRGRSSKNLSFTEAAKLLSRLNGFIDEETGERDREALIVWLAHREQAGDDDA